MSTDPNANSGSHDNPYRPYTQDHQNWNERAEQLRREAQANRDAWDRAAEAQREQERRAAEERRDAAEREQRRAAERNRPAPPEARGRRSEPSRSAPGSSRQRSSATPWSTGWAVVGALIAGTWTLTAVTGEERWIAVLLAAMAGGAIAGRFYRVILALGLLAVGCWAFLAYTERDQRAPKSPPPSSLPVSAAQQPPKPAVTASATGERKVTANAPASRQAFKRVEDAERAADLARKTAFPNPPNVSGVLFAPDDLDIYVDKVTREAFIFHGKVVDHAAISHLEYHYQDNWVAVVRKDGRRLNLGVHIQWLVRPYWREAKEVKMVRTHQGKSIEGRTIPLKKFGVKPLLFR